MTTPYRYGAPIVDPWLDPPEPVGGCLGQLARLAAAIAGALILAMIVAAWLMFLWAIVAALAVATL